MIANYEDDLICDLAETYHIFDYRHMDMETISILACGLGENSRIHRSITDQKCTTEQLLMAGMIDRLSILAWQRTENGSKGINLPPMLTERLLGQEIKKDTEGFATGDDFEAKKAQILRNKQ